GHNHRLVIYHSLDGGRVWKLLADDKLPAWAFQAEPSVIWHRDAFYIVARDQNTTNSHLQIRYQYGGVTEVQRTNLSDPKHVDTADLSFNPVTRRFELVRSNRHAARLELWSIDPDDWGTGVWRFEAVLFDRGGKFYHTFDGFHPGGAVIDQPADVQHIFIYSGFPGGPAGVFRITRTLDTPSLRETLGPAGEAR
ncbi:MAG: hypothetical protein ACOY3P_19305, partial [Planctomycetota bacterium]